MQRGTHAVLLLLAVSLLLPHTVLAAAQDPWQVLGVRRSATKSEITKAFRRLSRQYHPDKNSSPEATSRFQEISAAYDVLTDPKKAKTLWEATDDATPQSRFTATFGTVQFVLDLDPNRLRELVTTWSRDWAGKNWQTFGPLWEGSVDQSVCWCLENAWRLPKLTEPVSQLLASIKSTKHTEGSWRAWRLSGALLELSAWAARHSPCLQHHLGSSTKSPQEMADELQQQLRMRRRARQAAVRAEHRRQQRKRGPGGADGSSDESLAGFEAHTERQDAPASTLQGGFVWLMLFVAITGAFLLGRDRAVAGAALAVAALVIYAVSSGLLLPDETAVQQLGMVLDADGTQASLVGLSFVAFCVVVGLLLPLLLLGCVFLAITWVWAASTSVSLTITPALSQTGLALWMLAQLYMLTGGGDIIKGTLILLLIGYGLWKVPKLFKWWAGLLFAPVIFLLSFMRELLRAAGIWAPADPRTKSRGQVNQQAAGAAAAAQRAAGTAAASTAVTPATAAATAGQVHESAQQDPKQQQQSSQASTHQQEVPAGPTSRDPSRKDTCSSSSRSSSSSSSRSQTRKKHPVKLLREGAWWPKSFSPSDLAVTCHWYTTLMGWHLAQWCLGIATISCKLTATAVLFAVMSAAFGAPIMLLTLQHTVRLLLLRAGMGVGLLWKLWQVLSV